jgi:hypothetical protein
MASHVDARRTIVTAAALASAGFSTFGATLPQTADVNLPWAITLVLLSLSSGLALGWASDRFGGARVLLATCTASVLSLIGRAFQPSDSVVVAFMLVTVLAISAPGPVVAGSAALASAVGAQDLPLSFAQLRGFATLLTLVLFSFFSPLESALRALDPERDWVGSAVAVISALLLSGGAVCARQAIDARAVSEGESAEAEAEAEGEDEDETGREIDDEEKLPMPVHRVAVRRLLAALMIGAAIEASYKAVAPSIILKHAPHYAQLLRELMTADNTIR